MPIVTTRCVVLQTYSYSDTSKILRLMTREHGPRSAIARGALRPRSRFGGLIEPFAEGMATLYMKEGRDLDTLSGFELIRERQGLGSHLTRFAGASVLCELVMRLAPEHPDERLFEALVHGLDELLQAPEDDIEGAVLGQLWSVVSILGFAPHLSHCVGCGRAVSDAEPASFDASAGGLRCSRCAGQGEPISVEQLKALRALVGHGGLSPSADGLQRRILIDFIRYHLAEGVRIRSLEFLARSAL